MHLILWTTHDGRLQSRGRTCVRRAWLDGSHRHIPNQDAARNHVRIQDHIGRQLRAMYDYVSAEPVPERILELLKRLHETGAEQAEIGATSGRMPELT